MSFKNPMPRWDQSCKINIGKKVWEIKLKGSFDLCERKRKSGRHDSYIQWTLKQKKGPYLDVLGQSLSCLHSILSRFRSMIPAIMGPDYSTVCLNWWPVESNTSEIPGSIASKSTVQVEMTAVSTVYSEKNKKQKTV